MSWFFGKSRRSSQTDARRLVNDLAAICDPQYEQLKNGQVVLSLSIQSLQLILAAFADSKSVNSLSRDDAKRRDRLRVCLQHVRSAKLFGTSATLQGRIELDIFENLLTLSLFKVPIHLIDMNSALRRRIETLVCTRSLTQLGELLRSSRSVQPASSGDLADQRVASSSRARPTDKRNSSWRGLEAESDARSPDVDQHQPESNRLSGGAASWHDGGDDMASNELRPGVNASVEESNWDALVELHVVYNTIESLDASLLCCTRLRVLDLSHNGLRRIGPALLPLVRLEHVDLSYNFLSEFPRFCAASQRSLRSVALHYNMIETLDSRFKTNGSAVSDVDFRRFESLVELNLAQNLISNVRGLRPLVVLPRLSRLALCGNPLEFAGGGRYRARVLAYAVALHLTNTVLLDGTSLTPTEIREAERMRCAGDPLLRAADLGYRPLLPEVEDDSVALDGTQTDVDESMERVSFVSGRGARSDCDSPTLRNEDSLATTGPNSARKRRKRRIVRPRARPADANESSADLAPELAAAPAAVESQQSRLLTKEDMDACRKKLVNSADASWLNGLPQSYRDALNAQAQENTTTPTPPFESQPQQAPDSPSSDSSLRIIVGQSPPRETRNAASSSLAPSLCVIPPGSLDTTQNNQSSQEPPVTIPKPDEENSDRNNEDNKLSLSHIEYAPSSTPLEQSTVSVYETPCAAATELTSSNTTADANSQPKTPPKELTNVSLSPAKVNGVAEESHTSTLDESRHTDNESERTAGGQSTRSQSKRRNKSDASTRKRSVSMRAADETFLVTPVPASFLLSSAPTAVMESTQLFLVVNVALAERGVQLLDVDGGEPIETFDLRKLRYAARFRDSAVQQNAASSGHLPTHIVALVFAEAHAVSRTLRRFFEVEDDAAAAQLLALFEAPLTTNCSFMCITCRQTFVWMDESLVYSEEQNRDGFACPSACPRCGGRFVKEADSPSLPLRPSLNDNDAARVQPRGTTPVKSRSRKSSYSARKKTDGDSDSVVSFSLSQSQQHSRASSPLSSRLTRLRSVKQFQFDEESFALVDGDLMLLFSLNLLEQDEEIQLIVRCYVVLDSIIEQQVQGTERNRTMKKKGVKSQTDLASTAAAPAKQQVFAALVALTGRRLLVLEVRVLPDMLGTNGNGAARDGEPLDAQTQGAYPVSNCEVVRLAWQSGLKELHRVVPQPQFGMVSFLFGTSMLNTALHVALVDVSCFEPLVQTLQTRVTDAEVLDVQEDAYAQQTTLHLAQLVWSRVAELDSSVDTTSRQTREAIPVCLLSNVQSETQLANVTGQFALLVVSHDSCVLLQHVDCVQKRDTNGTVTPSGSLPRKALMRNARARARRQAEDTLSTLSAEASLASSLDSNNGCLLPSESPVLTLTRDLSVSVVLRLTDLNIDAFCQLERDIPFDSTLFTTLDVLRLTFENEASGQKQTFWLAPLVADGKRRLLDAIQEPWHALFGVPLELHPLRLA